LQTLSNYDNARDSPLRRELRPIYYAGLPRELLHSSQQFCYPDDVRRYSPVERKRRSFLAFTPRARWVHQFLAIALSTLSL